MSDNIVVHCMRDSQTGLPGETSCQCLTLMPRDFTQSGKGVVMLHSDLNILGNVFHIQFLI